MNKSNTDLSVLISFFETHNRTEGKSPRTVEWYNQVLGLLYHWLQDQDQPTTLGFLNEMVIRQFILDLQGRPGTKGKTMSSHSIYNRVNALRSFFGWLHQKGYTREHLLQGLKQPKTSEVIIELLADEEVEKILSKIDPNTALGARNTALVWLMLDTGLRLSEVASLKEEDVHLEEQYLKVMGKGSKERMVAFGVSCKRVLLHYYHYFRPQTAHEEVDTFFLAVDGYPLSSDAIKSVVKRLAKSSGVRRLHPHLLRHTYATNFLFNGGDIFTLKHNLGHTSLAMVQNYLHLASETAAVRTQGFSPMDRMSVKDNRRFRHSFKRDNPNGHIYPNYGRSLKRNGRTSGRVG